MRKVIVLFGLLSALMSCTNISRNPQAAIGDATCALPCWYGLSPGNSTLAQSETILRSLSFVFQPPRIQTDYIDWSFTDEISGQGGLIFQNGMLKTIRLEISGLDLGTAIDKFGLPEQVFPNYQSGVGGVQYSLTLYYPAHGIMIETYDKPQGVLKRGREDITRSLAVCEIDLFVPSSLKDFLNDREAGYGSQERIDYILQYLQPWPGFGKDVVRISPLN